MDAWKVGFVSTESMSMNLNHVFQIAFHIMVTLLLFLRKRSIFNRFDTVADQRSSTFIETHFFHFHSNDTIVGDTAHNTWDREVDR